MSTKLELQNEEGVLEVAPLMVKTGQTLAFEKNFEEAQKIIGAAKGYRSHTLQKCMENDHKYLLLVRWDRIEDHEDGFRKSAAYQKWKALLHQFYNPFPTVEHYTCRF